MSLYDQDREPPYVPASAMAAPGEAPEYSEEALPARREPYFGDLLQDPRKGGEAELTLIADEMLEADSTPPMGVEATRVEPYTTLDGILAARADSSDRGDEMDSPAQPGHKKSGRYILLGGLAVLTASTAVALGIVSTNERPATSTRVPATTSTTQKPTTTLAPVIKIEVPADTTPTTEQQVPATTTTRPRPTTTTAQARRAPVPSIPSDAELQEYIQETINKALGGAADTGPSPTTSTSTTSTTRARQTGSPNSSIPSIP